MKGHGAIEKTLLIWAASHAPQGEFSIDGDAVHAANISATDRLKLIEQAGHKVPAHHPRGWRRCHPSLNSAANALSRWPPLPTCPGSRA